MSTEHDYYRVVCRQCANEGTLHYKSDDWNRWGVEVTEGFRVVRPWIIPDHSTLMCERCNTENVEIGQKPFRSA
jgi:hypothetical protein